MHNFLQTLLLWGLLMLAVSLFYLAVTATLPNGLLNVMFFVSAVFVLLQALGIVDRRHGFGNKGNKENKK